MVTRVLDFRLVTELVWGVIHLYIEVVIWCVRLFVNTAMYLCRGLAGIDDACLLEPCSRVSDRGKVLANRSSVRMLCSTEGSELI
jgi:hypothetical protein